MAKPPAGAAWAPPPYENGDVAALQALASGTANEAQQKAALRWIIEVAADTYGMSYRPNSTHDTAFAEGKRAVGLAVVKLLKLNLGALAKAKADRAGN